MDPTSAALFGLIRATSAFAHRGDTNEAPLPTTTRAAAEQAAGMMAVMLAGAARQITPMSFGLRSLRDLVREYDGLLSRRLTQDPHTVEAIWILRNELVQRMAAYGEGGEVAAEMLDVLPAAQEARKVADEAARTLAVQVPPPPAKMEPPAPPAGAIHAQSEPAEAAPEPAAKPAMESAIEADAFRFPASPAAPLELGEDLMVSPPKGSKNLASEDRSQAIDARRADALRGTMPGMKGITEGIMKIGDTIETWGQKAAKA